MNDDSLRYPVSDGRALTPAEIARLDEIEGPLEDSADIPETSDTVWSTSVRGKHADAVDGAISIRLDADVLAWLRRKGPGHRAEISRMPRER